MSHPEKRLLIYLFFLALGLRLYVFYFTPVIGTDCYLHYSLARNFIEGQYHNITHPPLFHLFVASFSLVTGEYVIAGKTVALLFGVFAIFPLYFFTRSLFGHNAGIIAALLLAVNPTHVRLSGDIMRDTTHVFFFITSIYLTWLAVERRTWYYYALLGFSVSLDLLSRAEGGMLLLCIITPWLLFTNGEALKKRFLEKVFFLSIFLAPFLIFASIYLLTPLDNHYISSHIYRLRDIAREQSHPEMQVPTVASKERTPDSFKIYTWGEEKKYHIIFLYILNELAKAIFLPYLPLFLIGFFRFSVPDSKRESPSSFARRILSFLSILRLRLAAVEIRKEYFILSLAASYLILMFCSSLAFYVASGRYLLALVVLSLIWAGKGGEIVAEKLAKKMPRMAKTAMDPSLALLLLMAVIVLVSLPKDLKVKRRHEISQKLAGYWIKDHFPKRAKIMGRVWEEGHKVALYAQGDFMNLNLKWRYSTLRSHARKNKPDFLVFYRENIPSLLYSKIEKDGDFAFIKEWTNMDREDKNERHLRLYRFIPER
ncbi:MAG: glycosyltransferase family 39 protein [bacterium]